MQQNHTYICCECHSVCVYLQEKLPAMHALYVSTFNREGNVTCMMWTEAMEVKKKLFSSVMLPLIQFRASLPACTRNVTASPGEWMVDRIGKTLEDGTPKLWNSFNYLSIIDRDWRRKIERKAILLQCETYTFFPKFGRWSTRCMTGYLTLPYTMDGDLDRWEIFCQFNWRLDGTLGDGISS